MENFPWHCQLSDIVGTKEEKHTGKVYSKDWRGNSWIRSQFSLDSHNAIYNKGSESINFLRNLYSGLEKEYHLIDWLIDLKKKPAGMAQWLRVDL